MQLLPPAFIFRLKRILNRHSLHLPWRFRNYGIPYFSPRENIPQDLVCVSVSFIIFKSRIDTELYTFFRYVMAYSKEKQLSCPCISPLFHLPKENTSWHVIFIYCRRFRAKKKLVNISRGRNKRMMTTYLTPIWFSNNPPTRGSVLGNKSSINPICSYFNKLGLTISNPQTGPWKTLNQWG